MPIFAQTLAHIPSIPYEATTVEPESGHCPFPTILSGDPHWMYLPSYSLIMKAENPYLVIDSQETQERAGEMLS